MPLSGQGMLVTLMDVDPEREQDFNLWYDKEHLVDRVILPEFLESRRYIAVNGSPRYLNFYTTERFETLTGEVYLRARKNHTPWGQRHVPHFRNSLRITARVSASYGQGRAGVNAFIRLRPSEGRKDTLRATLLDQFKSLLPLEHIISVHLLEGEADAPGTANPGTTDWFIMLEGTSDQSVERAAAQAFSPQSLGDNGKLVSMATYHLMWDLAKWDLDKPAPQL